MKNILVEGLAGLCMLAVLPLAILDKLRMPTVVGSYLVVSQGNAAKPAPVTS